MGTGYTRVYRVYSMIRVNMVIDCATRANFEELC